MRNKIYLFLLITTTISLKGLSQVAYYDAIQLSKYIDPASNPKTFKSDQASLIKVAEILKLYTVNLSEPTDWHDVLSAIKTNIPANPNYNPFIAPYLNVSIPTGALDIFSNFSLSSIGSLDVTNLADGFAKFLVARTKEELNVAFFEKFKKKLQNPEYKDAVILFPQTAATLDAIGDQIYNYANYINALRESFEADVNSLLSNLPKVINSSRYNKDTTNLSATDLFFDKNPQLKSIGLSAAYIGNGLLNKVHPGQIIAEFDVTNLDGFHSIPPAAPSNDVKATMQTLQLFSESLRSKGTDHYWIDKDSLNILLNDPVALQIYFGLIYQKAGVIGIHFSIDTLQNILKNKILPSITSANNYIKEFINQTTILTQKIKNISGKEKDKLTFQDYYEFYSSSLDLIDYTTKISDFPGLSALAVGNVFRNFMQIARAGGNIALAINQKNYSSAIINAYQIYNYAFTATPGDLTNSRVKTFLLRYGSFVASVAQAENSNDVKKAIEAAALPSGSSRIKRETPFNVSLNAYTGLYGGWEKINGLDNNFKFNSFGVAAPIGVSISRGHSIFFIGTGKSGWSSDKKGWSTSLFLSAVDIGALAAFRFNNDSTVINDTTKAIASQAPNIRLKDIISPGAFLSIGIPKCPLSVNLGAQMGANLRSVKSTNNSAQLDFSNNMYWRFSISLCVDIPLLNFYTSSR